MKTPICLITPQSPFLLDERVFMHIGILKIASVLREAGHRVDVLDFSGVSEEDTRVILGTYIRNNPEVTRFGLTATTPQIPYAALIAKYIKEQKDDSILILGGTHVSLMHSAYKLEVKSDKLGRANNDINRLQDLFDILVAGDGEKIIFETFKTDSGILDADDPKSELFLTNDEF